jgi:Grx4 family monothiol glutaredoxin
VVLFMKGTPETPQCGFSRASIQILGLQGVDPNKFAAFNVLEDAELRSGIKEYSDWPTIPQLYINKEFVGGCDILVSMHQNGELAKLLEEKQLLAAEEGGQDQEQGSTAGTGAPTAPSGTSEKDNQGVAEKTSPKTSPQGNIGTDQNPAQGKTDGTSQGSTGTTGRSAKEQ